MGAVAIEWDSQYECLTTKAQMDRRLDRLDRQTVWQQLDGILAGSGEFCSPIWDNGRKTDYGGTLHSGPVSRPKTAQ